MEPCKYGHTAGRYADGRCKQCLRDRVKQVPVERQRQYDRNGRDRNPEKAFRKRGIVGPIPPKPILGACEACGKIPLNLHCDHDHATGLFRGWLCPLCNQALGQAKDSILGLQRLITYLQTKGYTS